jgi:cobalt-zinc-cadmium efflux system outer membrane protein
MPIRFEKSRGTIYWLLAMLLATGLSGRPSIQAQTPAADNSHLVGESSSWLRPTALPELEALALGNNPTLAQSRSRIAAAEGRYVQGGLYPNPEVGYIGEEIGNSGAGGQQGAFVGQRIITAKKLQLNRAALTQEIEQTKWALQAQEQRVLNDVRLAFYELLVARRVVELEAQLLTIGQQGVTSAEALLAAKEVSRADLLQARVEVESAAIELQNAHNRFTAACRRLAAVVGVPDLDLTQVQGDVEGALPGLSWDEARRRLLAESPQVARAQAGVQRARWALQRQCAGRVPDLDTLASVRHDTSTHSTIASVTIGMPLPVFDRNQGNIRLAQAELIDAEQEVQRLELQLHNRLATAFQRYDNARQQVERYSQNVLPTAQESLDLIVAGYHQGEFPYLTLLTAQRTYFRVNLIYLESLQALRNSTIAIEGLLLSGALESDINSVDEAASGTAGVELWRGISESPR